MSSPRERPSGAHPHAGDLQTLVTENLHTLTALLGHIRDNGRALLIYIVSSLYTALSTTTSFLIMFVIFFTTLFYVLAASEAEYKPLVWVRALPFFSQNDSTIVNAIENVFHR